MTAAVRAASAAAGSKVITAGPGIAAIAGAKTAAAWSGATAIAGFKVTAAGVFAAAGAKTAARSPRSVCSKIVGLAVNGHL